MKINHLVAALFALLFSNSIITAQGDLNEGIYWGYQAWHLAPNDGRAVSASQWYHWFDDVNTGNTLGVDMYPEMSEYKVTYPTNLKYPDGSSATLYSAYDYETIDLHIQWMRDYGIKGLFLQRQNANITSSFQLEFRDEVTRHVIKACEKYGVKFCMMPCNNDKNTGGEQMINKVINDWKHCVDNLLVLESPMYMKQNDKPVIGFWGLGFDNRPMLASEAHVILDFFQNKDGNSANYEVYVMGGVPRTWRTNPKEGGWDEVFLRLDMISPWRTLFGTQSDGVSLSTNFVATMRADIDYCVANNIDYNPVISPGASTATQHDKPDSFNWRKRSGGQFIWNQVYEVCKAYNDKNVQNRSIYGAMFDEVDEGTAIYKMATTNDKAPAGTKYEVCTLDEDGYNLPSDWYLRVAGEAQKMLEGRRGLSKTMPLNPGDPFGQTAYSEHNISLADKAIIQAEDFDNGGEDISYHDIDIKNHGGEYRPGENVDIKLGSDGFVIGWIDNGEWLEYTVNVVDSGTYNFRFTAASEYDDRTINLSVNDNTVGSATVTNTGADSTFDSGTEISDITLHEGIHVIRLTFSHTMNFDYFEVVPESIIDTTVTAISVVDDLKSINVYPVPTKDMLYIEGSRIKRVQAYDIAGNQLIDKSENVENINVSGLSNGIYFIRITTESGKVSAHKIIVL